jgi:hypothetical protein
MERRAMCSGFATLLVSSAAALTLFAVDAPAQAAPSARVLVQSSALAGFRYHAAAELWSDLGVGDALELVREPANVHDQNAVSLSWRGRKLGYVPRRDNAALAWALDRGQPVRARISRLTQHPNPARRIEFEVYAD